MGVGESDGSYCGCVVICELRSLRIPPAGRYASFLILSSTAVCRIPQAPSNTRLSLLDIFTNLSFLHNIQVWSVKALHQIGLKSAQNRVPAKISMFTGAFQVYETKIDNINELLYFKSC